MYAFLRDSKLTQIRFEKVLANLSPKKHFYIWVIKSPHPQLLYEKIHLTSYG
jgi:hypothetical protein